MRLPAPAPGFVSLLLAAALALFATPVPAQEPAVLFSDDFTANPLRFWTPSPLGLGDGWEATGGAVTYDGGGHTQRYNGDAAWTDYRVEVEVTLASGSNHPGGLRGRVDLATGAAYAAWLYPQDDVIKLWRATGWNIDGSGLTLLDQASVTLDASTPYVLGLVFDGDEITVTLGNATVIQVTDATLGAGAVALDVSNQVITFDEVLVSTLDTTPVTLLDDDFTPDPLLAWTASPLGLLTGWDASSGVAAYDGGGHTQLYAGDAAWDDYRVETAFRLDSTSNYPGGLRGRVDLATGAGYAAWLYPGDGRVRLWRATAWNIDTTGLTLLGEANTSALTANVFHTLALEFQDETITVYLNDSPIIQVQDGTHDAGAIALDVSNQPIDFDDVVVTDAAVPPFCDGFPTAFFCDAFNDGLTEWTASPLGRLTGWDADGGFAAYDGGGHTQLYAGDDTWTDYRVLTSFRLANTSNHPGGLRGRVNLSTGASYAAWLYPGDGLVRLFRAVAWDIDTTGLTLLGQVSTSALTAGVFHTLALDFRGNDITVLLDGVAVLHVTDSALAAGAVALDVSNQPIDFDNVVVTAPGGGDGPGGPIAVIVRDDAPRSRYYGEILLAEGLNAYTLLDAAELTAAGLASYDVVVLPETTLTSTEVSVLADWVDADGNLIALRPDAQLASLLGLTSASATLAEAYLEIDTGTSAGAGLAGDTLQFHGTADLYTATSATEIATLYSDATTPTAYAAVTRRSVGSAGGEAAFFAFDLARSVILTRQGNPEWAGEERDGTAPIRPNDLFFGNASGDPQPDWIDLDKVAIPQADEQQRLFAHLVLEMSADRTPLPRFWYLPRGEKAVVLMTGDDHASGGTAGRFTSYDAASDSGCSVEEWECVRGTSYVYPSSPLTNTQAVAFETAGFEVGLHVNTGCNDWTPATLDAFYTNQLAAWASSYPGVSPPATNRTHCIAWSDYASQPKVELAHGIRLDTNYYYWPGTWIDDRPGFFTGSGMPMRFADEDGTLIDVYQAATQMTDESDQTFPDTIEDLLDRALGSEGYYGVFTANMHTDSSSSSGSDAIVAAAQTRDVPIVTARQVLTWLDGRNGSAFSGLAWSGTVLTFTVTTAAGADGLEAMVPAEVAGLEVDTVEVDSAPLAFNVVTLKGRDYAVFAATAGDYEVTYTSP